MGVGYQRSCVRVWSCVRKTVASKSTAIDFAIDFYRRLCLAPCSGIVGPDQLTMHRSECTFLRVFLVFLYQHQVEIRFPCYLVFRSGQRQDLWCRWCIHRILPHGLIRPSDVGNVPGIPFLFYVRVAIGSFPLEKILASVTDSGRWGQKSCFDGWRPHTTNWNWRLISVLINRKLSTFFLVIMHHPSVLTAR